MVNTGCDLYRGQYLVGPIPDDWLPEWKRLHLAGGMTAAVHPGVQTLTMQRGERKLTLIGTVIDPGAPQANTFDVMWRLANLARDRGELFDAAAALGGRWVMIGADDEGVFAFHDAMGLRQVYYCTRDCDAGGPWFMSQPGLAARFLGFRVDPQAQSFMNSDAFGAHNGFMWPGDATAYSEVRRLLPNHYLDLSRCAVRRYGMRAPDARPGFEEATETIARQAGATVKAAVCRGGVVAAVRGGMPGQLLMAATRPAAADIEYIGVHGRGRRPEDERLEHVLRDQGLRYVGVNRRERMTRRFERAYRDSVYLASDAVGVEAESLFQRFHAGRTLLHAAGADLGAGYLRLHPEVRGRARLTPRLLSRLYGMGTHPFAVAALTEWLEGAERSGFDPADLAQWELDIGVREAGRLLESDIAWREQISPFNCRRTIESLLAVGAHDRAAPLWRLQTTVVERLWPGLMLPAEPEPAALAMPNGWAARVRSLWGRIGPVAATH